MTRNNRGAIGVGLAMALLMALCLGMLLLGGRMMMPDHGQGKADPPAPRGDEPEPEGGFGRR